MMRLASAILTGLALLSWSEARLLYTKGKEVPPSYGGREVNVKSLETCAWDYLSFTQDFELLASKSLLFPSPALLGIKYRYLHFEVPVELHYFAPSIPISSLMSFSPFSSFSLVPD